MEEGEHIEKEVDVSGMSETQKRLHKLKLKLNASRKANRVEVWGSISRPFFISALLCL